MLERSLEEQPAYSGRSGLGPAIGRFSRDSKGSIAILFALMLLPAALLMGLVIDLTETLSTRTRFQMAADAALLAAMAVEDKASRQKVAQDVFNANLSKGDQLKTLSVNYVAGGTDTTGKVEYSFKEELLLGKVHRVTAWIVNGSSVAEGDFPQLEKYPFDIEFWLDVSGSMAVGFDEIARRRLVQLSRFDDCQKSCIFACHVEIRTCQVTYSVNGMTKRGTKYDRAQDNGVLVRLDVMKDTVQEISSSLLDNGMTRDFNIGVFAETFRYVREEINTKTDLNFALDEVDFQMDAPEHRSLDGRYSFLTRALLKGAMAVKPPSKGQRNGEVQKIVVIITDGNQTLHDNYGAGPVDASACQSIKEKGIHVAVVHMPPPDDGDDSLRRGIEPCASPGFFFEANDNPGIKAAFDGIIRRALETKRALPIRLR